MTLVNCLERRHASRGDGQPNGLLQPAYRPLLAWWSGLTQRSRLLDVGDFSLLEGRGTHVLVQATKTHPLPIFILADRPLDSVRLRRMAAADGSMVNPETIPLKGSPHAVDGQTVYGLTTQPLEPGYFRLDLLGRGRISRWRFGTGERDATQAHQPGSPKRGGETEPRRSRVVRGALG